MRNRPHIGVPTQSLHAIDGIPDGLPTSWVMNQRYYRALAAAGGVPWMIPLLEDDADAIRCMYEQLDGVFLAGGVDVDPRSYGAELHPLTGRTDPVRDLIEMLLARWALEDGKPLLGVCRGAQILNIAQGGVLFQDIGAEVHDSIKHDYYPTEGFARDYLAHAAAIADGSRLRAVYGSAAVAVNSMHHQAIASVGARLVAVATAPDGVIEAIEAETTGFAVGVQWHPEMLVERDPGTRALFEAFVHAALEYQRTRAA